MTIQQARKDGRITGEGDAANYRRDPENFEASQPNPFGMDSQPKLHQAWAEAYENAFEAGKSEPLTKVIFRRFKKRDGNDLIALFPALAGDQSPHTCSSYQTIGQHGAASVGLVSITRKAKPEEYADLQKELERIGYRLKIAHKFTAADYRARLEQLNR